MAQAQRIEEAQAPGIRFAVECRFRAMPEDAARIKEMAAAEGRTTQDLLLEAVNALMVKRGEPVLQPAAVLKYTRKKRKR